MKKGTKIFLWVIFGCLMVMLITSAFMTPDVDASDRDIFFYRVSGAMIFLIWLIGVVIELDIFHVKNKMPLVKSRKTIAHVAFWAIILVASLTAFGVLYSFTSPDFRIAMEEKNKQNSSLAEEEELVTETESTVKEGSSPKEQKTVSNIEENNDNTKVADEDSDVSNEADKSETPYLIEDETYNFDDAVYVVNGIEVTVNSITLHRENKPTGYSLEVAYSLNNQNDTDATFEFSSQYGNSFVLDDKKARLTTKATWSQGHETSYHLQAQERADSLIGDFNALSNAEEKTIEGETVEAVDISNIYSNQNLTVVLKIRGIIVGQEESMEISFKFNL